MTETLPQTGARPAARPTPAELRPPPAQTSPAPEAAPPTQPRPTALRRLPRPLHPGAWWAWALGLAVACSRTSNPLILALLVAAAGLTVAARRTDAPWALSFRLYLGLGVVIVALRVGFRVLLAGQGPTVLLELPTVRLPRALTGAQLFGPISAEALLAGFCDGLTLAGLVVCVGAANSLANPKRLLAAVPGALQAYGTATVVALSVFPQLAESVRRIRRARLLRTGLRRSRHPLREVLLPVLADALDRSVALAAAMDSRGYGQTDPTRPAGRRGTGLGFSLALVTLTIGTFLLLSTGQDPRAGLLLIAVGLALAAWSFRRAGRRQRRTRYRPDRWGAAESLTLVCGLVPAVVVSLLSLLRPAQAYPTTSPLAWPPLPWPALPAALVAVLPAILTPPPAAANRRAGAADCQALAAAARDPLVDDPAGDGVPSTDRRPGTRSRRRA